MSNYLVFAGDNYYPLGGANDLHFIESELESAIKKLSQKMKEEMLEWGHIYSIIDKKIVYAY